MSDRSNFVPGGRYLIGMVYARSLEGCSCDISHIKLLSIIVYKDPLNLHQCSLGWEVSLGDELQYVKPKV